MKINLPFIHDRIAGIELTSEVIKICVVNKFIRKINIETFREFGIKDIKNQNFKDFIKRNKLEDIPTLVTLPLERTKSLKINLDATDEIPVKEVIDYYLRNNNEDPSEIEYYLSQIKGEDFNVVIISIVSKEDFRWFNELIKETTLSAIQITEGRHILIESLILSGSDNTSYLQDTNNLTIRKMSGIFGESTENRLVNPAEMKSPLNKANSTLAFMSALLYLKKSFLPGFIIPLISEKTIQRSLIKTFIQFGKYTFIIFFTIFALCKSYDLVLRSKINTLLDNNVTGSLIINTMNEKKKIINEHKKLIDKFEDLTKNKGYISGYFDILFEDLPASIALTKLEIINKSSENETKTIKIAGKGIPTDVYKYISALEKKGQLSEVKLIGLKSENKETNNQEFTLEIIDEK